MEAFAKLGRRALSPERWALLCRYFDALGPGKIADVNLPSLTISSAIEVGGITFLPAVYYPA